MGAERAELLREIAKCQAELASVLAEILREISAFSAQKESPSKSRSRASDLLIFDEETDR